MAVEKVSPGQKVLNRYVYTGGVFAGLAALTIAHYTWVRSEWDTKPFGVLQCALLVCWRSQERSGEQRMDGSWRCLRISRCQY